MKQETLKTGMAICGHCGGTYNRKECIRIYGEFSAPAIYGFCSASCYTQHDVKPEYQPQDESQKELFTGESWKVKKTGGIIEPFDIVSNNGKLISSVKWGIKESVPETFEEVKANAYLQAASPDMYRALKKCYSIFKQLADDGRYPEMLLANNGGEGIKFISDAINKANPNK